MDKRLNDLFASQDVKDFLDLPLLFIFGEAKIFKKMENTGQAATLRALYPLLKDIFDGAKKSENVGFKPNSEIAQGHRQPLFDLDTELEIVDLYAHFNASKSEIARRYKCSEKTIRNIIKKHAF